MAKRILGGLLTGAGKGLVVRGQQQREEAAALREAALERARERRERLYESAQAQTEREHERGLLSRTITGEDGRVHGVTRGGDTKDLGIMTETDGGGSGSGSGGSGQGEDQAFAMMSAEEKRTYEEIKNRYTNPNTNTVDWQNFISHLRDMPSERGGERWNEFADLLTGSVGTRMTREEAREKAVQEANQRKGFFSPRESEFPETDGDQQAWIEMRMDELMGGAAQGGGTSRSGQGQQRTSEGRQILQNEGGTVSTEETITIGVDDGYINIPTIFDGKRVSRDEAVRRMRENNWVDPDTGRKVKRYQSQKEAESAAQNRSDELGRQYGGGSGQGEQAQSGQRASVPPGKGTEEAPYKASTQQHVDWFLENAPAGAVIEANGQLYTK